VLLLSLYALAANAAAWWSAATGLAAVIGAAGVYASARLYVVPGRPAWNTPLTIVRFFATAVMLGTTITGYRPLAAGAATVAIAATAANWWRLSRHSGQAWGGSVRLELRWHGRWTVLRLATAASGVAVVLGGGPLGIGFVLLGISELIGRWLFYVTVVPLNMPGAFWRSAAGSHR
jgi:DMSO reductase anchor subunit